MVILNKLVVVVVVGSQLHTLGMCIRVLCFCLSECSFTICLFLFYFQDAFGNLGYSIVKVTVMMIGEYEYVTTFIDSISNSSDVTRNPLNPFPEIALVFIFAFLFLMSIILMNLLVRFSFTIWFNNFACALERFSLECQT